jgi:hypothetical protein
MKLPTLGKVPLNNDDLVIKATQTGIILLGKIEEGKLISERRYGKRYIGSKKHAIDINGNLWWSGNDLAKDIKQDAKDKPKRRLPDKKKAGGQPCNNEHENNELQIYADCDENARKVAGNSKKKAYCINKKEVRQRLLCYVNTQKGKKRLYFWTVSFPKNTPDDICYQALNTWLTSLRKYKMLKDYLWIAERQEGDRLPEGVEATHTIHFHIAIPHYLNAERANSMMRGTLKNLAKAGLIPYKEHAIQIKKYNGVHISKHRNTNVPINFAVKKGNKALAGYLTKYVTKNDSAFEHLAWHNSRGFSALFTSVTFTLAEFVKFGFNHFLNRVRVFKMEFATFVPWLFGPPPLLEDHFYQLNSYIQNTTDKIDGIEAATDNSAERNHATKVALEADGFDFIIGKKVSADKKRCKWTTTRTSAYLPTSLN